MLTAASRNGIRAALFLAAFSAGRYTKVREVAGALGVSPTYLAKILQALTASGILDARPGPSGGVRLAQPSESIRLMDLVRALGADEAIKACVLGMPGCGSETPCALHDEWSLVRDAFHLMMNTTTLAELAVRVSAGTHSLSDDRATLLPYLSPSQSESIQK